MLVPDSREPKNLLLPLNDACASARIECGAPVAHDCGDFWLMPQGGTFTIVERKKSSDFSNSIIDGRLFKQLGRCLEVSRTVGGRTVLLAEGVADLFPTVSYTGVTLGRVGIHPNSIRGAMLSLQELGVVWIPTRNGDDTIKALIWLYELAVREGKANGGKPHRSRTTTRDSAQHTVGTGAEAALR